MQELIQMVMSQMGTSEEGATGAVGGIMGMIRDEADPDDFAELQQKVPGTEEVIQKAEAQEGGGGIGGLLGGAASMVGGAGGGALDLMGILGKAGIDADQAGPLVGMVLNYLKSEAGQELVGRILGQVPQLARLAG